MSARRRRRAISSGVDKWKNKFWFDVRVPDYIGDESLGQTPASDIKQVIGRSIKISLMDITDNFNDLNYRLKFKITQIAGNRAKTEFFGQELSRDYRRSQIRNHRSQVDGIFNLNLSDGSRVRVTTFVVTPVRAPHNTKKAIRKSVRDEINEICSELTFPAFVNKLITYELREELLPAAEEVYPIKLLEVSKVKVLKLPPDREMQDISELEMPGKSDKEILEETSDEEIEEDEDEEEDEDDEEEEEE